MKILDLPVETRDQLGSANARRLRRAGRVPCVLYGRGKDNVSLVTDARSFDRVLTAHSALVRLTAGEEEAQTALVRQVTWDVFGEHVEHIDFIRVELEDEVKIKVPVHCVGIAEGIHHGGQMQVVQPDVEVYSRVDSIPTEIRLDVTALNIGDGIHIGDLEYPENVRAARDPREIVVHVKEPRKAVEDEEVAAPVGEGEAPAEGAEPAPAEGDKPAES